MRRWAQTLAVILSTGYILCFYSERMFWSQRVFVEAQKALSGD